MTNNVKTENVFFKYLMKKANTPEKIQGVLKLFGVSNDDISEDGNLADALEMELKDRQVTADEIISLNSVLGASAARLVDENYKEMLRRVSKVVKTKPAAAKPTTNTTAHSQTPAYKPAETLRASGSIDKRQL